ncbi:prolipoprotein diacylglyceryl transferase family protein [Conexibacter sp. DBS9H8]|uniref:prolipoprotein diacylglyceryl transferase family protein n=1 Tax=Conexibacter sp. DBS9H8 TaxID=2937801 RepID=UPI00200D1279|nr:prolipoprotein diacylglyceryl transferase family protein [Conexibacter sp. DBS9H8]
MPLLAYIPSPPANGFHVGPFFFHFYGIMYVIAVAVAIVIARHEWELRGGSRELIYEAAWWGFPAGLVGGRIYYDITTPPSHAPWYWPVAIWDGGLGIWGGVALGAAVGVWRIRRKLSWPETRAFMNVVAPVLLFAQAIGRIGNYFNQELYGKPSTLPWAVRIARPDWPAGYHVPLAFQLNGGRYATFEPSFLYELIFDICLGLFLVWLGRRDKVRAPGIFALYIGGYSGYRIFEETIRIDYSQYILGMRLNFWIAILVSLAGFTWFAYLQWFGPRARRERAAGVSPADGPFTITSPGGEPSGRAVPAGAVARAAS